MPEEYVQWFESLQKPGWIPSFEMLGEFWIVAYPLAMLAFCLIIYLVWSGELKKRVLCPVIANLLFSLGSGVLVAAYPALIFLIILIALYALTLGWVLAEVVNIRHRPALLLLAPYTLWVVSVSVAVLELARLNW